MTGTDPRKHTDAFIPDLLDRSCLLRRWQHGSEASFWRYEKRGLLTPMSDGSKLRYTWSAVFDFEGSQPPIGMREAYKSDLLTEHQAAHLYSVKPSYILTAARAGDLPSRRIGRAFRFVPAELEAWQNRRFMNRKSLKKSRKTGNE